MNPTQHNGPAGAALGKSGRPGPTETIMSAKKSPANYKPSRRLEPAPAAAPARRHPNLDCTGKRLVRVGSIISADGPSYGVVLAVLDGCLIHRRIGAEPKFLQDGIGETVCDYCKDVDVITDLPAARPAPDALSDMNPASVEALRVAAELASIEASVSAAIDSGAGGDTRDHLTAAREQIDLAMGSMWDAARCEFYAAHADMEFANAIR